MQRFHISRNGQTYGPYTLEELERYVASGHILLSDLARPDAPSATDAASEPNATSDPNLAWVPVSQLLPHRVPAAAAQPIQPGYAPHQAFAAASINPPNLHWGLVLLFDCLTCSFFQIIWNLVLASWFRRVVPSSRVLLLYIAATVMIVVQFILGQVTGLSRGMHGFGRHGVYGAHGLFFHGTTAVLYLVVATICWVVRLIARFTFRADLERHYNTVEPLNLSINPVLTFFFGGLYLQSVMNEINTRRSMLYPYPTNPNIYPPR